MRTTVNIDDEMFAAAISYTGIREKARLLNFALEKLVEREAAKRLKSLGGTAPELEIASREKRISASLGLADGE